MDHTEFELSYWGDCCNTYDEETKQFVYAALMGLDRHHYSFNVHDKKILDIGGGPSSLLLKTFNLKAGKVIDPLRYPDWTIMRYAYKNIECWRQRGEDIQEQNWDEVWIYNCLQHVDDPELIILNALKAGRILRLFEWIDIPPHPGHPQELTKNKLDKWIGTKGKTIDLAESGCYGKGYYAVHTSPFYVDH